MDREPPLQLTQILIDIDLKDAEAKHQAELAKELEEKSSNLHDQAMSLLRTKGESRTRQMGTGEGGGVIGYRYETTSYMFTKSVKANVNDDKVVLQVVENLQSGPNYTIYHEGVSINLRRAKDKEAKTIFKIANNSVTNWLNERATLAEMSLASEILSYVDQSLPKGIPEAVPKERLYPFQDKTSKHLL